MTIALKIARQCCLAITLFTGLAFLVASANAVEIQKVETASGIKALLVEDYTLPLISVSFSFKGGSAQDPENLEGVVRMMSALFDEGAGEMDSVQFRSTLEEEGIELGFSTSLESINGGMRMLASDQDKAFDLLKLALTKPRFDEEPVERMRNAILTGIKRSKTSPGAIAGKIRRELLYRNHQYSRPSIGTKESIEAVTVEELRSLHRKLVARENLVIGVVGAITKDQLSIQLERAFGELPAQAALEEIAEVEPATGKSARVDVTAANSSVALVYRGVKRNNPDFFAAHLMNHILGGGTFSSRLYEKIREKSGLVYSVYSSLVTLNHAAYLIAGTSTRAENEERVIELIRNEIRMMAENGVTEEELRNAKKFVKGSYAINNLDTSGKIASVLVAIQSENLGIDYIDRRQELIDAVTLEDVNRMARELLSVEPTQIIVGPPAS